MALALAPRRVLTPEGFRTGVAVRVQGARIEAVVDAQALGPDIRPIVLDGDLVPGLIDLQVNGGAGVLFNDAPTADGVRTIASTHRRFGTTGLLPTLISDDLAVVRQAIAAVDEAIAAGAPGVLGIHVEGPFLNGEKKGIHDAAKFRRLDDEAVELLTSLRGGRTLVTLAPELGPPGLIRRLVDRGVIVFAGHTAATYEDLQRAFDEGLSGFTHLFNAMTQLNSRAPGAVGAALERREAWCGLIADGHHVHPAALRVALAAKGGDHLVLVTDAMPTVGSAEKTFRLGGQLIRAEDGRCVAPDGTLAGSDLDMAQAVRNAVRLLGVDLPTAVRMASAAPAAALGLGGETGAIRPGLRADFVLLDGAGQPLETWIGGERFQS